MNNKNGYADLEKWRKNCHDQRLRYYRKTQNARNSYKRWSKQEVEMVLRHDISDTELSVKLGRSVQAIQLKRSRMKEV